MTKTGSGFQLQTFSIGQAAKLIDFPGGRKKFYNWLRSKNFILNDNFPSQEVVDRGWFKIANVLSNDTYPLDFKAIPRITLQGLAGLEKIRFKEFPICQPCQ